MITVHKSNINSVRKKENNETIKIVPLKIPYKFQK